MPRLQRLFCIPQRCVLAIMGFFAFFNAYTLRICLSIAITKMAKSLNHTGKSIDDTCPAYDDDDDYTTSINTPLSSVVTSEGTFEWSEYTQGIILPSFYWGYFLTHIPSGLLSEKFSAKYILGLGMLLASILTTLTPFVTFYAGAKALIILRFLIGLGEGFLHPAMNRLLSQWIPANERSLASSFVFTGIRFGILVSGALSGLIMRRSADNWPSVFHLFGAMGIVWFVFWMLVCYDNPQVHPFIRDDEKDYLKQQISAHVHEKSTTFPWRRALTSKAFVAVIIAQLGQDWNSYTVLSDLPKYLQNVLKLPVHLNGYASSLYSLTTLLFCLFVSWMSDWSIERNYLSRKNVRKINTAVSSFGPAGFLLLAMYVGCDIVWAVTLITVGLTLFGCSAPGVKVNPLDLSPNYAATLLGISNGTGALMGIFAPYVVGVLAPDQTLAQWRLIFWISAVISVASTSFYLIFAEGEVQEWNDTRSSKDKREDVEEHEQAMDVLASVRLKLRES